MRARITMQLGPYETMEWDAIERVDNTHIYLLHRAYISPEHHERVSELVGARVRVTLGFSDSDIPLTYQGRLYGPEPSQCGGRRTQAARLVT
jgi:hypothetical protein